MKFIDVSTVFAANHHDSEAIFLVQIHNATTHNNQIIN
jgi:hypothetical protein